MTKTDTHASATPSRLVATAATQAAKSIEDRFGTLADSGESAHILRQELVNLISQHVKRVASGVAAGQQFCSVHTPRAHRASADA